MHNFHRRLDLKWGGWNATLPRNSDGANISYMNNRGVYASPYPVDQMEDGDVLIGGLKLNATTVNTINVQLAMFLYQSADPTVYMPRSGSYQELLVLPSVSELAAYGINQGDEYVLEWKLEKVGSQVRVTYYLNSVAIQTSQLIDIGSTSSYFIVAAYNQTTSTTTYYRVYGRALYETDDPQGRLGNWDVESVPVVPYSGHNVPEAAPSVGFTVHETSHADFTLDLAERPEDGWFLGVVFETQGRLRRRSLRRTDGDMYFTGFNEVDKRTMPLELVTVSTQTRFDTSFYSPRNRAALAGSVFRVGCELKDLDSTEPHI